MSGVVPSLVIILLLVIAIVIAVVRIKRNCHKQQSSDTCNVEMDEHYCYPTSITLTTPSEEYISHYGTPQQTTLVQSASETSLYDNVNNVNDDPTSSEQQIHNLHPYNNIIYDVQPAGPNITASQTPS